ncbi:hypothetical protein GE061_013617 [Apolygus lucorum]|uniref:Gem-associated protein 8 n=1 Tax=Apolygus lucorum TaxID=248454 RepID=A0A8S9XQC2_APOLU|nr:hypothetical protein GE061_013617 [Apolygus lucorum]
MSSPLGPAFSPITPSGDRPATPGTVSPSPTKPSKTTRPRSATPPSRSESPKSNGEEDAEWFPEPCPEPQRRQCMLLLTAKDVALQMESKRLRRKLKKAARYRGNIQDPAKWKSLDASHLPKSTSKAPFLIHQGLSAMSGNWFWLNYYNVFQWKDHHLSNSGVAAYSLPGQNVWPADGKIASSARGSGLHSTAGNCEPVRDTSAVTIHDDYEEDYIDEGQIANDVDSDEDIVVTEEMMQFLEISMRHKASINVKKEEAKKRVLNEAQMDERNATEDCLLPSDEADNERRHSEMTMLYGDKAPMIHGMETALQLTFNRQVDLHNPSYWPIHPFTIQFKS